MPDVNKKIYEYLNQFGFEQSYKGFAYLSDCIELALALDSYEPVMVLKLYEEVAKKRHTNKNAVERSIRNLLLTRQKKDKTMKWVTNKRFITEAANYLRFAS